MSFSPCYPSSGAAIPRPSWSSSGRETTGKSSPRRARDAGLAEAVFIPGWLTDEELTALYRASYAFAMPSRQEGFGLAYLEAMNHGLACVGCSDQGSEEVIVDGETGLLVADPSDAEALLAPLDTLLSDPDLASGMGERGFERLHRNFLPARYRDELGDLLEPLLR